MVRILAAVAVCLAATVNPLLAAGSRTIEIPHPTRPTPSPAPLDRAPQTDQQNASADNRGTDQVPFVVKELPRERSEEEKLTHKEKAALDRRLTEYTGNLASYTKALFIGTLALAALTGALAFAAFFQTRDSRKSIAAAETAAKATRDNAQATLQTVQVLRNAQRPYLSPLEPILRNYDEAIRNEDASLVGINVQLDITNVGPGLGFIRSYGITHEICPRDSQRGKPLTINDYIGRLPLHQHGKWVLEGDATFHAFRISNADREAIFGKNSFLYIYGHVRYLDLFQITRRTGFLFECIPETGVLVMCPHTLWYDIEEEPEAPSSGRA
jgi:hypothetical protein